MLFFNDHDLYVYFSSSRWIAEGGLLYRNVPSEYLPLANILFAICRYASSLIFPSRFGSLAFSYTWVVFAGLIYVCTIHLVATRTTLLATLAWAAPGALYFALYRFDIYPAIATLLSLLAIRRDEYLIGAFWLGIAAALKGYALFMLPAFCVFMIYRRGLVVALCAGLLVLAPLIISLLLTAAFVDFDAAVASLKLQAQRGFNGESTYDAANYLFGTHLKYEQMPLLPQFLQVASAIVAAAMRPRTFDDLVNAFLFATLGFVTFCAFYSPQFLLWILPITSFSNSRAMLMSAVLLSSLTYVYIPLSIFIGKPAVFRAAVVVVSLLRLSMMVLALRGWRRALVTVRSLDENAALS